MSDDRLDTKLRQVLKERVLVLETDNKKLRDDLRAIQQDFLLAQRNCQSLKDDAEASNIQWSERLAAEHRKVHDLSSRIRVLSLEQHQAVELNAEMSSCLSEVRKAARDEGNLRVSLEASVARLGSELRECQGERDKLQERVVELYSSVSEKESSLQGVLRDLEQRNETVAKLEDELSTFRERCERYVVDAAFASTESSRHAEAAAVRVRELEGSLRDMGAELELSRKQLSARSRELETTSAKCGSLERKVSNFLAVEVDVGSLTAEYENVKKALRESEEKRAFSEETVTQLTRQVDAMEDSATQMVAQKIELEKALSEYRLRLEESESEAKRLQAVYATEFEVACRKHADDWATLLRTKECMAQLSEEVGGLLRDLACGDFADADTTAFEEADNSSLRLIHGLSNARRIISRLRGDYNDSLGHLREVEEQVNALQAAKISGIEMNAKLSATLAANQNMLESERERFDQTLSARDRTISDIQQRIVHYENELGSTLREIEQARRHIEAQKDSTSRHVAVEEEYRRQAGKLETACGQLSRELEVAKRALDGAVLRISELERDCSTKEEERRVLQIEVLQLKAQLKREQQEVRSVNDMHHSLREALERRAHQNQEVVNAAETRASALETELSEVISKYNTLAQSHKELKLRSQQQSAALAESESRSTPSLDPDVVSRQRRLMYELNLRLAEQEAIVSDLTIANQGLITSAVRQGPHSHPSRNAVLSVQPLNTSEGPIRHPKRLRPEGVSNGLAEV